jgi:hypothetical protein
LHRLELAMQGILPALQARGDAGSSALQAALSLEEDLFTHGDRALRFLRDRVVILGVGRARLRKGCPILVDRLEGLQWPKCRLVRT